MSPESKLFEGIVAKQLSSFKVYYLHWYNPCEGKYPCSDKQHAVTALLKSCDHACMRCEQWIISGDLLLNPCNHYVCQNLINTQRAEGVLKLTALTLRDVARCKPTAWMNYKQWSQSQCCCYPGLLANVVKCALKREPDPIWCPLSPEAGDVQMARSLSLSRAPSLSLSLLFSRLSLSRSLKRAKH